MKKRLKRIIEMDFSKFEFPKKKEKLLTSKTDLAIEKDGILPSQAVEKPSTASYLFNLFNDSPR
jgi:hypothetical protein